MAELNTFPEFLNRITKLLPFIKVNSQYPELQIVSTEAKISNYPVTMTVNIIQNGVDFSCNILIRVVSKGIVYETQRFNPAFKMDIHLWPSETNLS